MIDYAEEFQLQSVNGSGGKFGEIGTLGLEAWFGYLSTAYESDLEWPAVYKVYNRIRRSDPAIGGIIRPAFVNMARRLDYRVDAGVDNPGEVDDRAVEYLTQVLDDIHGGFNAVMESWVSYAPFMGWHWQEEVLAIRRPDWRPPGEDDWRSKYNDGLVGLRRLAHRDHSSFYSWEMDDATGRVMGMNQQDYPNPLVTIPRNRSLHLTFGDDDNPEGLSPLEAIYRIERRMRAYELVHGIGSEHTAGYLEFKKLIGGALTDADRAAIKAMARSAMSAREANFIATPEGIDAKILSVAFEAADSILDMIRFLYLVELQIYSMQFVSIATTAGLGSQTAIEDSRAQSLDAFNGMISGFVRQFNEQTVRRLFRNPVNAAAFPGLEQLPKVAVVPLERSVPLSELAAFVQAIAPVVPIGKEDYIAIRQKSGFLPEEMPENDDVPDSIPAEPEDESPPDSGMTDTQAEEATDEMAQLAQGDDLSDRYGDEIALLIMQAYEGMPRDTFEEQMGNLVTERMRQAFMAGANIGPDDVWTPTQLRVFAQELQVHLDSISGLADEVYSDRESE